MGRSEKIFENGHGLQKYLVTIIFNPVRGYYHKNGYHRHINAVMLLNVILILSITALLNVRHCDGYMVGHNPHYRSETLDTLGRYQLEWLVDIDRKLITFNVTVLTKGYVGFGMSAKGTMKGADIVIGGVTPLGKTYFTDRHSVGNHLPNVDTRQDWNILDAWESPTHTFLSFSRAFDTCDPEDYPISADKVSLIWAYGETDMEIGYHHQHRGSKDVYLLDPDYSPQIIRDLQDVPKVIGRESLELKLWTISKRIEVTGSDTSYLCTIHKGPRLHHKHHLIGFDVHFNTEETQKHVQNVLIYKCNAPVGNDARSMFEPFLKEPGQSCLIPQRPEGAMPTDYCTELFHEWGIGGQTYFTPNEVGYPMGLAQDEYYMVQVQYDHDHENPHDNDIDKPAATIVSNIVVDFDLEMYYTSKVRAHDAGIMLIGHETPGLTPSLLIPPNSANHMIFGHCGSECTKMMFPPSGIRIFATMLFSHGTGRKLRLQHFRNNRELYFVSSDDNYSSSYKQVRNLRDHLKILPGDHLIMRCVYDNTKRNGTVVGGFKLSQEVCFAYIHFYNKISEFSTCKSEIISEDYRRRFLGVTNVTWNESRQLFQVDASEAHAGLSVLEVSDNHVLWEPETRAEFERFHKYHPQINRCPRELYAREEHGGIDNEATTSKTSLGGNNRDDYSGSTGYPFNAKEFQLEPTCSMNISY